MPYVILGEDPVTGNFVPLESRLGDVRFIPLFGTRDDALEYKKLTWRGDPCLVKCDKIDVVHSGREGK